MRAEGKVLTSSLMGRAVFGSVILLSVSFLLLWRLAEPYLWQDEAQTALIARTILSYGLPLGHDGFNSFSHELGAELSRDLVYKWHPWLPFYLLAGCFRVLGVSTWSARLPFALLGIASVLLVYRLGESLFASRRLGIVAMVLLVSSVPFLLLARQCRYYSPAICFSLLGLFGYVRGRYRWVLGPASVCLFFSQSLYFAALWLAVLAHAACFARDRLKELLWVALLASGLPVAWLLYTLDMNYQAVYPQILRPAHFVRYLGLFSRQIYEHLFHPLLLALPLVALVARRVRGQPPIPADRTWLRGLALLLFFLGANLALVCAFSVASFFRYLGPMIPAFCLVTALLLCSLSSIHRYTVVAAVVLYVATSSLPDYLVEITHGRVSPEQAVAQYLNEHGRDRDTVAVTYGDMPLKLYTRMRVLGGLTGENLTPARHAEWIWLRKQINCPKDAAVKRYLLEHVDFDEYAAITLPIPDRLFDDREDPALHRFRPAAGGEPVVLLRRRRAP